MSRRIIILLYWESSDSQGTDAFIKKRWGIAKHRGVHTATAGYYVYCMLYFWSYWQSFWIVTFQLNVVYFPPNTKDTEDVCLVCDWQNKNLKITFYLGSQKSTIIKKKRLPTTLIHCTILSKIYKCPTINIFELDPSDSDDVSGGNHFWCVDLIFPSEKLLDDFFEKLSWNKCFRHFTKVPLYLSFGAKPFPPCVSFTFRFLA